VIPEIERRAVEEIDVERQRAPSQLRRSPKIQRADELLRREFPATCWAVRDLVPAGVSLLVGPPKIGKSWLALQFAIAVSGGTAIWPGRDPEHGGEVLLLGLEDNDRRMRSRISKLRAVPTMLDSLDSASAPDVSRLHFATEWPRLDAGGIGELDQWLVENPNARLVIVDTLARVRPQEGRRSSAYQDDYAIAGVLKPLADRYNVALVLVHHTRKMAAADVLDTVSGTQGLAGSVDALLMLRRERAQMDAALYVTGRDIEQEQDYALRFDPTTCRWSSSSTVREASRTNERQAILDLVAQRGASTPKEIAERLGKKGSTIRRLLQKLHGEGELVVHDHRYSIPGSNTIVGNSGNADHANDSDHADYTTDCVVDTVTDAADITSVPSVTDVPGVLTGHGVTDGNDVAPLGAELGVFPCPNGTVTASD
jgi:hypothetical protein